ncbi:hypothetical protein [Alkalihalobacillus trypoxylicola]|uniref:RNA polymerase sigma factor 70 region 4 type 2 domain-containing protein n=1 Tax=Alkalihalobacillus trypoxylicola TaxID=519424 RepID=A0A162ENX4_9BACI|nr:hypothetical protein [Alkalihalobacillus trypoxylicola]KYG33373.1 hypothetical protein AZF04_16805 [Alkalihalobacillus trypoxylicola]
MKNGTANLDFFHRRAISRLKKEERDIYLFIIQREFKLESIAESPQEYLQLLREDSPILKAAHYFGMDASRVKEILDKAEATIENYIKVRSSNKQLYSLVNYNRPKQNQYFLYYE